MAAILALPLCVLKERGAKYHFDGYRGTAFFNETLLAATAAANRQQATGSG